MPFGGRLETWPSALPEVLIGFLHAAHSIGRATACDRVCMPLSRIRHTVLLLQPAWRFGRSEFRVYPACRFAKVLRGVVQRQNISFPGAEKRGFDSRRPLSLSSALIWCCSPSHAPVRGRDQVRQLAKSPCYREASEKRWSAERGLGLRRSHALPAGGNRRGMGTPAPIAGEPARSRKATAAQNPEPAVGRNEEERIRCHGIVVWTVRHVEKRLLVHVLRSRRRGCSVAGRRNDGTVWNVKDL